MPTYHASRSQYYSAAAVIACTALGFTYAARPSMSICHQRKLECASEV